MLFCLDLNLNCLFVTMYVIPVGMIGCLLLLCYVVVCSDYGDAVFICREFYWCCGVGVYMLNTMGH